MFMVMVVIVIMAMVVVVFFLSMRVNEALSHVWVRSGRIASHAIRLNLVVTIHKQRILRIRILILGAHRCIGW